MEDLITANIENGNDTGFAEEVTPQANQIHGNDTSVDADIMAGEENRLDYETFVRSQQSDEPVFDYEKSMNIAAGGLHGAQNSLAFKYNKVNSLSSALDADNFSDKVVDYMNMVDDMRRLGVTNANEFLLMNTDNAGVSKYRKLIDFNKLDTGMIDFLYRNQSLIPYIKNQRTRELLVDIAKQEKKIPLVYSGKINPDQFKTLIDVAKTTDMGEVMNQVADVNNMYDANMRTRVQSFRKRVYDPQTGDIKPECRWYKIIVEDSGYKPIGNGVYERNGIRYTQPVLNSVIPLPSGKKTNYAETFPSMTPEQKEIECESFFARSGLLKAKRAKFFTQSIEDFQAGHIPTDMLNDPIAKGAYGIAKEMYGDDVTIGKMMDDEATARTEELESNIATTFALKVAGIYGNEKFNQYVQDGSLAGRLILNQELAKYAQEGRIDPSRIQWGKMRAKDFIGSRDGDYFGKNAVEAITFMPRIGLNLYDNARKFFLMLKYSEGKASALERLELENIMTEENLDKMTGQTLGETMSSTTWQAIAFMAGLVATGGLSEMGKFATKKALTRLASTSGMKWLGGTAVGRFFGWSGMKTLSTRALETMVGNAVRLVAYTPSIFANAFGMASDAEVQVAIDEMGKAGVVIDDSKTVSFADALIASAIITYIENLSEEGGEGLANILKLAGKSKIASGIVASRFGKSIAAFVKKIPFATRKQTGTVFLAAANRMGKGKGLAKLVSASDDFLKQAHFSGFPAEFLEEVMGKNWRRAVTAIGEKYDISALAAVGEQNLWMDADEARTTALSLAPMFFVLGSANFAGHVMYRKGLQEIADKLVKISEGVHRTDVRNAQAIERFILSTTGKSAEFRVDAKQFKAELDADATLREKLGISEEEAERINRIAENNGIYKVNFAELVARINDDAIIKRLGEYIVDDEGNVTLRELKDEEARTRVILNNINASMADPQFQIDNEKIYQALAKNVQKKLDMNEFMMFGYRDGEDAVAYNKRLGEIKAKLQLALRNSAIAEEQAADQVKIFDIRNRVIAVMAHKSPLELIKDFKLTFTTYEEYVKSVKEFFKKNNKQITNAKFQLMGTDQLFSNPIPEIGYTPETLFYAQELYANGKSLVDIKKETGWERLTNGHWMHDCENIIPAGVTVTEFFESLLKNTKDKKHKASIKRMLEMLEHDVDIDEDIEIPYSVLFNNHIMSKILPKELLEKGVFVVNQGQALTKRGATTSSGDKIKVYGFSKVGNKESIIKDTINHEGQHLTLIVTDKNIAYENTADMFVNSVLRYAEPQNRVGFIYDFISRKIADRFRYKINEQDAIIVAKQVAERIADYLSRITFTFDGGEKINIDSDIIESISSITKEIYNQNKNIGLEKDDIRVTVASALCNSIYIYCGKYGKYVLAELTKEFGIIPAIALHDTPNLFYEQTMHERLARAASNTGEWSEERRLATLYIRNTHSPEDFLFERMERELSFDELMRKRKSETKKTQMALFSALFGMIPDSYRYIELRGEEKSPAVKMSQRLKKEVSVYMHPDYDYTKINWVRDDNAGQAHYQVDSAISDAVKQKYGSGKTSLRQVTALFKKVKFKSGTTNLDLGGGKFDEGTEYLATKGVKNLVYDPVNRDSEHNKEIYETVRNGGVDTVTCANVLNVIAEKEVRSNIILQCAKALKDGGTAYFTVYEGDGTGNSRQSQSDSWQEHRKTADYLNEIKQHFANVTLKNKVITATNPIVDGKTSLWFTDASFTSPMHFQASDGLIKRDEYGLPILQRGQIVRGVYVDNNMYLFEHTNISTFSHESAHYFMDMLKHLIANGIVGDNGMLKKYYDDMVAYCTVKVTDADGNVHEVYNEERIAVAFEKYLMEGTAPSVALAKTFRNMRHWLSELYKHSKTSYFRGIEISPEIREVFDAWANADMIAENCVRNSNFLQNFLGIDPALLTNDIKRKMLPFLQDFKESESEKAKRNMERAKIEHKPIVLENIRNVLYNDVAHFGPWWDLFKNGGFDENVVRARCGEEWVKKLRKNGALTGSLSRAKITSKAIIGTGDAADIANKILDAMASRLAVEVAESKLGIPQDDGEIPAETYDAEETTTTAQQFYDTVGAEEQGQDIQPQIDVADSIRSDLNEEAIADLERLAKESKESVQCFLRRCFNDYIRENYPLYYNLVMAFGGNADDIKIKYEKNVDIAKNRRWVDNKNGTELRQALGYMIMSRISEDGSVDEELLNEYEKQFDDLIQNFDLVDVAKKFATTSNEYYSMFVDMQKTVDEMENVKPSAKDGVSYVVSENEGEEDMNKPNESELNNYGFATFADAVKFFAESENPLNFYLRSMKEQMENFEAEYINSAAIETSKQIIAQIDQLMIDLKIPYDKESTKAAREELQKEAVADISQMKFIDAMDYPAIERQIKKTEDDMFKAFADKDYAKAMKDYALFFKLRELHYMSTAVEAMKQRIDRTFIKLSHKTSNVNPDWKYYALELAHRAGYYVGGTHSSGNKAVINDELWNDDKKMRSKYGVIPSEVGTRIKSLADLCEEYSQKVFTADDVANLDIRIKEQLPVGKFKLADLDFETAVMVMETINGLLVRGHAVNIADKKAEDVGLLADVDSAVESLGKIRDASAEPYFTAEQVLTEDFSENIKRSAYVGGLRLKKAGRYIRGSIMRLRDFCQMLDNWEGYEHFGTEGFMEKTFFDTIKSGLERKYELKEQVLNKTYQARNRLLKYLYDHKEIMVNLFRLPSNVMGRKGRSYLDWTPEMVLTAVLHLGCEENRQRMAKGFGWDAEEAERNLDMLANVFNTREQWNDVQTIWECTNELFNLADEIFMKYNNVRMLPIVPHQLQVKTENGIETIVGGYMPLTYDSNFKGNTSTDSTNNGGMQVEPELIDFEPDRVITDTFSRQRLDNVDRKLMLSLAGLSTHIDTIANYVALKDVVHNMNRLLANKKFAQILHEKLGRTNHMQFMTLIDYAINGTPNFSKGKNEISDFFTKVYEVVRRMAIDKGLLYNYKVLATQLSSALIGLDQVGWGTYFPALAEFYGMQENIQDATDIRPEMLTNIKSNSVSRGIDYVNKKSTYMRMRFEAKDVDFVRDINKFNAGKVKNATTAIKEFGYKMIAVVDAIAVYPMWIAAYNKCINMGISEKDAINAADKLIGETQGSGSQLDRNLLQSSRLGHFFLMFSGASGAQSSQWFKQVFYTIDKAQDPNTSKGKTLKNFVAIFGKYLWIVAVPSILNNLATNLLYGNPDQKKNRKFTDEEWLDNLWKRTLSESIYGSLATIPMIREVGEFFVSKNYRMSVGDSPATTTLKEALHVLRYLQTDQGKAAYKFVELLFAYWGVPAVTVANRVYKTYNAFDTYITGRWHKERNLEDVFSTK